MTKLIQKENTKIKGGGDAKKDGPPPRP